MRKRENCDFGNLRKLKVMRVTDNKRWRCLTTVNRSRLDLHRENSGDGFADFGAMNAVERQRQLRLHQAVGNPGVVALALGDDAPVFVAVLPQMLLGGGELDFVLSRGCCS